MSNKLFNNKHKNLWESSELRGIFSNKINACPL